MILRTCALAVAALVAVTGCSSVVYRAGFTAPVDTGELDRHAPFLKAHLADGSVYVLEAWKVDSGRGVVTGRGLRYTAARKVDLGPGELEIAIKDVALFETNSPESLAHTNLAFLAVLGVASAAVTAACLLNPKACFGSCPTFYAPDDEPGLLRAEGFSDAVAPSLEHDDVDALGLSRREGPLRLRLVNEAWETHVVRSVEVLAAPKRAGGRVLRAGDRFVQASRVDAPLSCASAGGDCREVVAKADRAEYATLADGADLATRETLELVFPAGAGPRGLVVTARNSLLNTYLFYQLLAYAGSQLGDWLGRLDAGDARANAALKDITGLLGDVDVEVFDGRGWVRAGAFSEVGPLALEEQLVRLPEELPAGPVRVRLSLTQGNWRIDRLGLATLGAEVQPVRVQASRARRLEGEARVDDALALSRLAPGGDALVTVPGDDYELTFDLPAGDHELFLASRGYYFEWMRGEWLADEDPGKLLAAFVDPAGYLRRVAPAFKRVEPQMENLFWKSRFSR